MKTALLFLPPVLAHILFGAHLLFHGFGYAVALPLVCLFLLFVPRNWMRLLQFSILALWSIEWVRAGVMLVMTRLEEGRSPTVAGLIMAGTALFTLLAAFALRTDTMKRFYRVSRAQVKEKQS